ncbi:diphosphoinositol polyphosphate phosphohydrolase 1-like isoform X1 [Acropora millepora]|uniref:diphosphoinositol polyphosphate phosphohydrolase 1-like isoform X1 n=1 Tax=Acropora millepora TaxID=45264 RepID=UPI0010FCA531|nr:diphosphoinositol polyphosphate phosphohydrolase 1-like isoform X1 [Acropora millepora]
MLKNRENSVRTKDKDGYTRRAGCICFKTEQEKEVLLVTSWRHPGRWVVPSGGVEPGEDSKEAAIREVVEEAGVRGKLGRFLGEFQNDVNHTRTSVYVLIVTEELETWQEDIGRIRSWFSVDKAKDLLAAKPYQQQYLAKACCEGEGSR